MAMDTLRKSAKGINVTPTSSFLHLRIEDVDCSSITNFPLAPIDGQFVIAIGKTAHDGVTANKAGTDGLYSNAVIQGGAAPNIDHLAGGQLAMVWLSQFRTDQDALGSSRVPVVRGSLRFKTKLIMLDSGVNAGVPSLQTVPWVAGTALTVACAPDTVTADATRLVLAPVAKAGYDATTYVVGFVVAVIDDTFATPEVEVQLYEFPRLITESNN